MTNTPWGEADTLRSKQLPPGPGMARARVERSQRHRLLAATVAVVAEKGYEATRVADLLEVSGVSRNAFYKLYRSKHDCFLATVDAIVEMAGPAVLDVYDQTPGAWDVRLAAMLDALAATIVAQPAMARIGWIEVYAAGPEAIERIEQIDVRVEKIVRSALDESREYARMPPDIVRAVIGGVRKLIHTRLRQGRESELPAMMPEAFRWMLSYRTPPERLWRPRKPRVGLAPKPDPRPDARERILAAVTEIVAEKSYSAMAITEIATRAAVSLTTFYGCFAGKEEAFAAAIERGRRRTLGLAAAAYAEAEDWPQAVAAGTHALIALFTLDTGIARLGGVAAYEGGRSALESPDEGLAAAQAFLQEGYRLYPETPEIAAEAVGATFYALVGHQIRRRGADRLYETAPTAVYLTLAPFIGSDAAAAMANERLVLR